MAEAKREEHGEIYTSGVHTDGETTAVAHSAAKLSALKAERFASGSPRGRIDGGEGAPAAPQGSDEGSEDPNRGKKDVEAIRAKMIEKLVDGINPPVSLVRRLTARRSAAGRRECT